MSVYKPTGSDTYVYDFQRNKERFTGSCETDNHAAAKRVEREGDGAKRMKKWCPDA